MEPPRFHRRRTILLPIAPLRDSPVRVGRGSLLFRLCRLHIQVEQESPRSAASKGFRAGFAGADTHDFQQFGDEYLAVTDLARAGRLLDRLYDRVDLIVSDRKLIDPATGAVLSAGADYDYAEVYFKTNYAFTGVTYSPIIKGGVYYSPDYFGEDGDGVYGFGTFGVTLPYDVGLSATVGYLTVEGDKTTGGIDGYDYVHYSIGVSKAVGKINLNLSWNDADSGCTDLVSNDRDGLCEAVVFAVSSVW